MLNEVNAHISILRMLTTTAEQCKTLHFNVTCSKHSVQLAEIRSKSLLEMCKVTNKPLLQMRYVQSHPLCKLARSQNCSYKLTDDMIYCWLGPFSRISEPGLKGFHCLQRKAGEMEARSHYRLKFDRY